LNIGITATGRFVSRTTVFSGAGARIIGAIQLAQYANLFAPRHCIDIFATSGVGVIATVDVDLYTGGALRPGRQAYKANSTNNKPTEHQHALR
jgi:hypothetical protein